MVGLCLEHARVVRDGREHGGQRGRNAQLANGVPLAREVHRNLR